MVTNYVFLLLFLVPYLKHHCLTEGCEDLYTCFPLGVLWFEFLREGL